VLGRESPTEADNAVTASGSQQMELARFRTRNSRLGLLKQGAAGWNAWRAAHRKLRPHFHEANLIGADLRKADLREMGFREACLSEANLEAADLTRADFRRAHLRGARLHRARLHQADLSRAELREADLRRADLREVDLREADVREADLRRADLRKADLRGANLIGARFERADLREARLSLADFTLAGLGEADLRGADLSGCRLVETELQNANLSGCRVFRVAAWAADLQGASQTNLLITRDGEPAIAVDGLEVAQYVAMILGSQVLRGAIAPKVKNAVLVVGCFAPKRTGFSDAIRKELRRRDYLPILLDPAGSSSRDWLGLLSALARLSRFAIVDLSRPSNIPKDWLAVIPTRGMPVQPIHDGSVRSPEPFWRSARSPWVLRAHQYSDLEHLARSLYQQAIRPAEAMARNGG
jgi:uncharacterized protein YjbI with pentapeptide repeats